MVKSIRILGKDYRVRKLPEREADLRGDCAVDKLEIRVSPNLKTEIQADTILHEVLHAIWWEMGLRQGDDEERIVATFATAILAVMRDNGDELPRFMDPEAE